MDVLFKLRFVLWTLVLGLWGLLVWGFYQEDVYQPPRLTTLQNPFPELKVVRLPPIDEQPSAGPEDVKASPGPLPTMAVNPALARLAPVPVAQEVSPPGSSSSPAPLPPSASGKEALPKTLTLASLPKEAGSTGRAYLGVPHDWAESSPSDRGRAGSRRRQHEEFSEKTPAALKAPPGFTGVETAHFQVYFEGGPAPRDFLTTIENLHTNVMLDLAAFAPWARTERVKLYIFQNRSTYQDFTGRPEWSGGASSVDRRTVYLYKSSELIGILAHELCHVYFDSFFASGKADPLWLSEGMATFIQIQRGLAAPNWIRPNMDILVNEGGFTLKKLMKIDNLSTSSDAEVRLWYAESYSIVHFLVRSKWFVSYFQFCKDLRDGASAKNALLRAYGMPYNSVSSLEYAWRYDLKTHGISNLAMRSPEGD